MKVAIFQPRVPYYRASFFRTLKERGGIDQFEYQIFSPKKIANLRKDEDFDNSDIVRINSFRIKLRKKELHLVNPFSILRQCDVIVCEHALHDIFCLLKLLGLIKKPLVLWGHGKCYTADEPRIFTILKNTVARRADCFLVYTQSGKSYLNSINYPSKRITILNNSIDVANLRKFYLVSKNKDPNEIRNEYGIHTKYCFLVIGGLDESKRIDFLVDTARELRNRKIDFTIAVCGSGPLIEILFQQENFKTFGFADDRMKADLSIISLAILNPGRVGLIAVDSFVLGCPIITTNWGYHAPEFDYLQPRNSIVTEDSISDYVSSLQSIVNNSHFIDQLKKNCLDEALKYSIESMVENFHLGICSMLDETKNDNIV